MNFWSFLKEFKPLAVYDVECGMAMAPMQGNGALSRVDLGYTEQFCVPDVTSVSFSSCDSVLGDSLECHQAHRGSLRVLVGTWNCSACNAGE